MIEAFKERTGYGIIVNTSFNVRGEPIVCTPQDAYLCFMRTEMDVLVLEDLVLLKNEQPELEETRTGGSSTSSTDRELGDTLPMTVATNESHE